MRCLLDNIQIKAIATYLPPAILEMDSLTTTFGEKEVKAVKNATGVERVHRASKEQTASDMCLEAAKLLLEKEQFDPQTIDALIFVSETPDYKTPGTSLVLQSKLGLSKEIVCFDINYGCSGYIYGIYQAALLINSGSCNNVLLLNGNTTTKMINIKDRPHVMVFGDCAAATLLTKGHTFIGVHIGSDGYNFDKVIIPAGGYRNPSTDETRKEYTDANGNIRTPEDLYMDGDAVFGFIVDCGQASIRSLLDIMNWDKDEVDFYAMHQATKFTLSFLRKRLKLDINKAPINITNYGNTSSATVPLVLTDLCNNESGKDTSNWHKVVMAAYGVGLSWGSIACDLSQTHIYKPINQ